MHKRRNRLAGGDGWPGRILLLTILVGAISLIGAISYSSAAASYQFIGQSQTAEQQEQGHQKTLIAAEELKEAGNGEITKAQKNILYNSSVVRTEAAQTPTTPTEATATESLEFLGALSSTAYTHDGSNMANGEAPYVGAVACNLVPIGTILYIEGLGKFVVKDRIGHGSQLDIFMDAEDECNAYGRRTVNVYIVN